MRIIALLFFSIHFVSVSKAQLGVVVNRGAASLSMAGTYLTFENEYSLFSSPANLATIEDLAIHVSGEQRFLRSDLLNASFGLAKNIQKFGSFSIHANQFGIDEYKEVAIKLGYARKLDRRLNIGINFSYLQIRVEEYGSKSIFNTELGISSYPLKNFMIAAHVIHPFRTEVSENSRLPMQLNLGAKYTVSNKAFLTIEFHKEVDFEEKVIASISYSPIEVLSLRTGFSTNPGALGFGIGLKLNNLISVDFGFQTHQFLSPTPGFSALYNKQ